MRNIPVVFALWLFAWCAHAELPPGTQLLSKDALVSQANFNRGQANGQPVADSKTVSAAHPEFTEAIRVSVENPTSAFYNGSLRLTPNEAVSAGDVLLAHFYFRSVENTEESGAGFATIFAQGPAPEYRKYLVREVGAGSEWQEFFLPFVVLDDLAAGQFSLNVGVGGGAKPQVWEIGGLELINFGSDVELADLPVTRVTYGGREPDAGWRAAAQKRIEKHRMGDFSIRVLDANGERMPDVKVEVKMRRHAYQFGSAISVAELMAKGADARRYRETLLEYFNQAGPENGLKWPPWAGDWDKVWNREQTIAALEWLKRKGFFVRGHVMVWPSKKYLPAEIGNDLPEDPQQADPAVKQKVLDHITDVATATADCIDEWDVVNEPYTNHYLMDAFGDDILVDWFQQARRHLTWQALYLNDYGILSSGGRDYQHQQHFEKTLRYLIDHDAPITGMGMQGHFGYTPTDIDRVYEILDHFHEQFPELAIRVTEFDVNTTDEALQGDYTRDFLTIVFSHPATVGVQCWGFWAGRHWRPEAAMFTHDWRAKPNAEAWRRLVKETWWGDYKGRTNDRGVFSGRGFYGDYEVIVTTADQMTVNWEFRLLPEADNLLVVRIE